jgi:ketosteroid isomerase-like protein
MSDTFVATQVSNIVALIKRLYDLEMAKNLDDWMDMWDASFVITFPFATHPAMPPIRGKENLRSIIRQKFIDRVRIELGIEVMPFAYPLKALVHLDVTHVLEGGRVIRMPLICLFEFNSEGRIVALEEYFNQAQLAQQ